MENTASNLEIVEDVEACHREGRRPRDGVRYKIAIGDDNLNFQFVTVDDPVPTGCQIVGALGLHPADEFIVLLLRRRDGDLEELGIDKTVDLREPHVEKFLVFKGAEIFRFELDGQLFEWGAPTITGMILKRLAKVDLARFAVWQEIRGGADIKIEDAAAADLTPAGLERFFTGIAKTREG